MDLAVNYQNNSWAEVLKFEKDKSYFQDLLKFVEAERSKGKAIYPAKDKTFNAFKLTPLDKLKVLILGQDPYHGPNQAHGLAFSVMPSVPPPPSLINIFKELRNDLDLPTPPNGDLTRWAERGVLLLNSVLSVEAGRAGSHANKGWELFTDEVIRIVSRVTKNTVFILWGSFAQKKIELIDTNKHLILKSPHPSPLSATRGFFGSKPFSKTNEYLVANGILPIDWHLE
jgi:uracil-DNA glycosylase